MRNLLSLFIISAALIFSNVSRAQSPNQQFFFCQFVEYGWHHIDDEKRVMQDKGAEEFIFTFSPPKEIGEAQKGSYKNIKRGWGGSILITGNASRITILEDTAGDNAFIASLFSDKSTPNQYKAVMTLHSVFFGVRQLKGSCR